MAIQQVQAYLTSDGSVFKDPVTAAEYENRTRMEAGIEDFWAKHGWSGMTVSDVVSITIENIDELKEILK